MPGLFHDCHHFIEGHAVTAIGGAGVTRTGESLGRGKDIALDTGDLHHPIDRITGQPKVML